MIEIVTEYDEDAEDFEPLLPEDSAKAMEIAAKLNPMPPLKNGEQD